MSVWLVLTASRANMALPRLSIMTVLHVLHLCACDARCRWMLFLKSEGMSCWLKCGLEVPPRSEQRHPAFALPASTRRVAIITQHSLAALEASQFNHHCRRRHHASPPHRHARAQRPRLLHLRAQVARKDAAHRPSGRYAGGHSHIHWSRAHQVRARREPREEG